jgi:hypothetical protein
VVFTVLSALLLIDGLYLVLANYHPADANTFFGNQTWNLSDGEVVLISAGFFTLATAIMWALVLRGNARSPAREPAGDQSTTEQPERPSSRTASKA